MPAQNGSAFLLKVGDGGSPITYETVAGMRTTQLSINGDLVAVTNKESGGIFLGSDSENSVRAHALAGTIDEYELSFEDGERLRGRFLVQRLDYSGDFNGERNYTLLLESSGPVVPA